MDTKTFLDSVLSSEGHPCLITIDLTQTKPVPKHYWFKNVDELVAKASQVDTKKVRSGQVELKLTSKTSKRSG